MAKILIVEDEKAINDLVKFNLELVGHECSQVFDGESGLTEALKLKYDLIILDVMLPKYSGFEIMEYIEGTPVIFVTAKSTPADKIKGLRLGADDYIMKPYTVRNVIARVKSVLRRTSSNKTAIKQIEKSNVLQVDGLKLDLEFKRCTIDGEEIKLARKEFELLVYLVSHRGKICSREQIMSRVWSNEVVVLDRTIDVNITRLRSKIGAYGSYIVTRSGFGYGFRD